MQDWSAETYTRNARFVAELGMPVVELLAPQAGERILDLGCGDGALTARLAQLGASVLGVDASADMIAAAKAAGLDARVVDGESLAFDGEFDAVFSNAALHWMKAPQRVIAGVWSALKPGGRFVGEMGGRGNVAQIVAALDAALAARGLAFANPWYFPSPDEYRALLEAAGFRVSHIELIPRPTLLPGDIGGWLETFARPSLAALANEARADFIADMVERLRGALCDAAGDWRADYVRLRFAAHKPQTM